MRGLASLFWNEPSRKKKKYEVIRARTSDVQAAGLFERERNIGECTKMEVANCLLMFSS